MTTSVTEAVPTGMFAAMTGTATPAAADNMDKDMFLKLLVAQMKYQDPLNPADSTQFLTQTAQFTALEKMGDVAEQTAQLVSTQTAFGASSLVGRSVSYTDAEGATVTGTVVGVTFGAEGPRLDVDGVPVALAAVRSVTNGAGPTPAPDTSSDLPA